MHFAFIFILFIHFVGAIEVPPGLRPAKAVDDPEKPIVPKLEEQQEGATEQHEQKSKGNDNKPLIFQKKGKENKKKVNSSPTVQGTGTPVVQQVIRPNQEEQEGNKGQLSTKFPVRTVSSVPILVPDVRNAKSSRASASRVESEAEKPVQIKFSG
uniref:Uncharacterized protein n=1 Tax=Meloidogyne floridensis TaxID=298350 RepID=A0A915NQU2_9BILA